jgi:hypothetical protein
MVATPEYEKSVRESKEIELKVPNLVLYLIHELIHLHLSEVLNNLELVGRVR